MKGMQKIKRGTGFFGVVSYLLGEIRPIPEAGAIVFHLDCPQPHTHIISRNGVLTLPITPSTPVEPQP